MEYHLYNENGRNVGITGVEPTHSNWTLTPYIGGFVKEFWNGSQWIESASIEEINTTSIIDKDILLKRVLNKILLYSRALAMGKSIDDDLEYFEKAYTNKYEMCKGLKPDSYSTLQIESVAEGFATLQEYKDYVIEKYEIGKGFYDTALQLSEVMRKLVINDCTNNEINKAMQRLTLVDELPTTITVAQVSEVFNQVMAI